MTEPKRGWLSRLSEGLSRTSKQMTEQVAQVLVARPLDQDRLDALEEMLIEADLGPAAAARIAEAFSAKRFGRTPTERQVQEALAEAVADELSGRQGRFEPLGGPRPFVVLFIGVNGSGKTTTLGKIAADLTGRGAKVLIAAGDTFRAAAVEQLAVWAERSGADFISRPTGADATGLAYDALERARAEAYDVLLIDTAGRLAEQAGIDGRTDKDDPGPAQDRSGGAARGAAGAGRHRRPQRPGAGERLRQRHRRHRHRHDQAGRHRSRRRAGAGGAGLRLADQAGRRGRGHR